MKKIQIFCLIAMAFVLLQSGGCNKIKELDYKGIKSAKLESINFHNTAIRINLEYFNPNNFSIDVKETNLSIFLDDQFVALADQPEKTKIPKNALFEFPIVAHFDPLKIMGPALKSFFAKTTKLRLQGTAKLGKDGVFIKVPVDIVEEINLRD